MTKITDLKNLRKIIGDNIVAQSGIPKDHVAFSQTRYGATIQKNPIVEGILDETTLKTISENDAFVVFDINNDISTDDIVEDDGDAVMAYASFTSTVMFYGKDCGLNAIKVKTRFLTQELISDFESKGVHIQAIDSQRQINEYLNGSYVSRQDIIIHFSCEIDVSKLTIDGNMTTANVSEAWLNVA